MSRDSAMRITDALYGPINLDGAILDLIRQPIVQRLRHVRLSNIDSVCIPGISNISRYEHSLGVAFLASQVGFNSTLSTDDSLVLQAASLIHDSAITPFGHLAEEAYWY